LLKGKSRDSGVEEKRGAGITLPDVRGRDDNFLVAFKRESLRGGFAPS